MDPECKQHWRLFLSMIAAFLWGFFLLEVVFMLQLFDEAIGMEWFLIPLLFLDGVLVLIMVGDAGWMKKKEEVVQLDSVVVV